MATPRGEERRVEENQTRAGALISLDNAGVAGVTVFTLGHSTRPIDEFIVLLTTHGVQRLIDVRKIPQSRHNPQFGRDQLSSALEHVRIHYTHMPGLGGLRRPRKHSINMGWRNASFRGYADYMQSPEFEENLEQCIEMAKEEHVALMCAEAVPWRCHRSLIADALLARGIDVREITSAMDARPHALTPWARVEGTKVTYPGLPLTAGARDWGLGTRTGNRDWRRRTRRAC